jgi:MmyB-like transcription regulator ligand binding domain
MLVETMLADLNSDDVGKRLLRLVDTFDSIALAEEEHFRAIELVVQDTWLRRHRNSDAAPIVREGRRMRWLDQNPHATGRPPSRARTPPRGGTSAHARVELAQHPGDPRFAALTVALREASPDFRRWWDADAVELRPHRWQFEHPSAGRLILDFVKLAPNEPNLRIVAAMPADANTSEKLPALTALA